MDYSMKSGFCFDVLFGLNSNKTQFTYPNEVKTIMRYISGSNKEEDGDKMIFPRIHKLCSEKESRTPFTQIWFLPPDNINKNCNNVFYSEFPVMSNK